jgi:transposase
MVRNRDATTWDAWLARAAAPQTPGALRQFAKNLCKDLSAVKAALTLPRSNAQLEGQINRLKTIKR